MSYCLIILYMIGKNWSFLPTISLTFKIFYFIINLKISTIFILPIPNLGLIWLSTCSFKQLLSTKFSRRALKSETIV